MALDLAGELRRYGPGAPRRAATPEEGRAYCRRLARSHYENFTVASRLAPRRLRQHLCNVYAYCRWADDLADEKIDGFEWQGADGDRPRRLSPSALLDWWRQQLDAAYGGEANHPVFVALRETIAEFRLPKQPFVDLLEAFQRDQTQTRYASSADLLTYCQKSANPVGRIVLCLGRSESTENVALADSICTGLQLANFWQDVKRDYLRGRIYIPQDACDLHGWNEARFAAARCDPAFQAMLAPLVADAEGRLLAGRSLIGRVQRDLRMPVRLFVEGGLAILAAIRRRRYDVWSRRPTIGRFTKLRLMATAVYQLAW